MPEVTCLRLTINVVGGQKGQIRLEKRDGSSFQALAEDGFCSSSFERVERKIRELRESIEELFWSDKWLDGHTTAHVEVGKLLWEAFFKDAHRCNRVGEAVLDLRTCDQGLIGARLDLVSDSTDVLVLPWEFLYVDEGDCRFFPVYDWRLRLVRRVAAARAKAPSAWPLKVWVCLSCPADRVGFNTLWSARQVETEWRRLLGPYASIEVEGEAPSPQQFLDALFEYDVIYFLGHGEESANGLPCLVLTEKTGAVPLLRGVQVTAEEIAARAFLGKARAKLLILNCCNSAAVATEVLRKAGGGQGPTVIAHQFTLPVGCAFHFQRAVMPSLLFAHDKGISEAVAEWRCRSDIVRGPSPRDSVVWGVPTVFAPGYADGLAQDPADVLVENSCLIGPTGGPLGLTRDQANRVLASLRNAAPSIYRALEAAFGGAQPYIPFYQDVELDPFAIDVYPVTNHLYDWYRREVDNEAPDRLHYEGEDGSHPAQVTWEAARRYCERMGRQLPTIQQWERAARGESQSILPWGDDLRQSWRDGDGRLRCNVSEARRGGPVPVFESEAGETRWGSGFVRDMIGNVPEWTSHRLPDGRVAVMGMGYRAPLAANVPSCFRYVDPGAYYGFRCVSGSPR